MELLMVMTGNNNKLQFHRSFPRVEESTSDPAPSSVISLPFKLLV